MINKLLRIVNNARRLRETAPVDDDFPKVMHDLDASLHALYGRDGHIRGPLMNSPLMPTIVCLCGSTRFKEDFIRLNAEETGKGHIVLSVGFFGHADQRSLTVEEKARLDALHLRKVELADEMLVVNRDGYIGESTRNEIDHALTWRKPVRYAFDDLGDAA